LLEECKVHKWETDMSIAWRLWIWWVCGTSIPNRWTYLGRHFSRFVSKNVTEMENREKRNILYWWFMVNVYHISGKNKRKRPPLCLIKAIREQYPNPSGELYVDFKQAKKRKR
jgi:hypothetical protein